MIEIWQELSNFHTNSQRLADKVWTIIKKGWFSDLEIIEIHQKINDQQSFTNTLPSTLNNNKEILPIQNESPTSKNEYSTQPNTAQPNKPEQTLSKESKLYLENLKRIMIREKITLPSLRNIEWRIVRKVTN